MSVIPAVRNIIDQLSDLLHNLPNDDYSKSLTVLSGSSIGQHVRHTLEFFTCLYDGLCTGQVNYDERQRDIFLESNTLEAKNCLSRILSQTEQYTENVSLQLIQSYEEEESVIVETNLFRELVYNVEHAVHHMALIRVGLKEVAPDFSIPEEFGYASSTVKYKKSVTTGG